MLQCDGDTNYQTSFSLSLSILRGQALTLMRAVSEGWVDRDVSILAACLDWVQCTERQQVCVVATLSVGVVPGEWHNAQGTYSLILHQSALTHFIMIDANL